MNKWIRKIALSIVVLTITSTIYSRPVMPPRSVNVPNTINRAIRYHDISDYEQQITQVANHAQAWFLKRITKETDASKKKLAVVFDIDETLVSNYVIISTYLEGIISALNSLHNGRNFEIKYNESFYGRAFPAMKQLFNTVKGEQVAIFLITANQEKNKAYTATKLRRLGYQGWEKIFFKPNTYRKESAAPYKTSIRKQLTQSGYKIIFNIGDQDSDLAGGYAEKKFKLPNPYYYIP
jgi:predicted secreted acid phosphatase